MVARPGLLKPASVRLQRSATSTARRVAAETANRISAADQLLYRFPERGARHAQLGRELSLGGQAHARLKLMFGHVSAQALYQGFNTGHGIIQGKT